MKILTHLSFVLVAMLVFACAGTTTHMQYEIPKKPTAKMKKVLVVGITGNKDARDLFEKELAWQLRKKDIRAFPSIQFLPKASGSVNKDEIIKLVETENFDAVVTMKLLDVQTDENYSRNTQNLSDPNYLYYYNYLSPVNYTYRFDLVQTKRVIIESIVYEAASKEMIFYSESSTMNIEDSEAFAGDYCKSLTYNLLDASIFEKMDKEKK